MSGMPSGAYRRRETKEPGGGRREEGGEKREAGCPGGRAAPLASCHHWEGGGRRVMGELVE